MDEEFATFSIPEVAEMCRIGVTTIRNWVTQKILEPASYAGKEPRFTREKIRNAYNKSIENKRNKSKEKIGSAGSIRKIQTTKSLSAADLKNELKKAYIK